MDAPIFEFDLRLLERDSTNYYYPRWDLAQAITVRASSQQDAINKAAKVLGGPSRRGWVWTAKVDAIREVTPEEGEQ